MYIAYKYRIYPNKEQEKQIQKTVRYYIFLYNKTLVYKQEQ